MPTEILQWLKCLAMALVCFAVAIGIVGMCELPDALNAQANETRAAVLAEVAATEGHANARLTDALAMLDKRSGQALAEIHAASVNANVRTGQALDIVGAAAIQSGNTLTLFEANTNGQLTNFNATLAATLRPLTETAQQVDDALPYIIDCDPSFAGADCFPNRYLEIANETEDTLKAVAAAAPKMATQVELIAASSAGVAASADATGKEVVKAAKRFNAPQTKMQALKSWLLTFARLYGAI